MQPPPLQSLSDLYPPAQHASTWDLFTTLWIENPTPEWSIYGSLNGPESSPVGWQNLIWSLWCCAKVHEQQQGARTHLHTLETVLDTMRIPDKATVPSDMSLDLHFGCRFSPGCGGLVHLHLAGQASATLRKTRLTCKKTVKLHQWLTRFQIATERCKKSCKSAIHCRFLPPLSGQPEGYRNYLPRTATCPRNNRQPVKLLETKRCASMINQSCTCVYHEILTLFGCYFWGGDGLHDLI